MKYYLLAGEASGDLHGSYLMRAIQKADPAAEFRFWGGDKMAAVGGTLVIHYKERAFMGFTEVIRNLRKILGLISTCKKDIEAYHPDRLIFIDNSGFNLRIAKWAKPAGLNTHYYISPQVWASRASRIKTIKATIDSMYVVLPFVKEFYGKYDYDVHFVGHPLLDVINDAEKEGSQSPLGAIALGPKNLGKQKDLQSSRAGEDAAELEGRMKGDFGEKKYLYKYVNLDFWIFPNFQKSSNFVATQHSPAIAVSTTYPNKLYHAT